MQILSARLTFCSDLILDPVQIYLSFLREDHQHFECVPFLVPLTGLADDKDALL